MNIFNLILIAPLTNGLILFYRLLGENMGLAIIGFSLALRFLLNPLTKPYMESMKKIKEVEPQLKKLKEKYKNDQKGLMQAQSDFYKEKGVNPSAGCLPYLLQIVVLIALFNVFTRVLSVDGDIIPKLNELLYPPLRLAQETVLNTKFLWLDVTKPDNIVIPGLPFALPGIALILAALVQLVSAQMMTPYFKEEKKIAKKTESKEDDLQVSMQKSMSLTFPLFTLIIGLKFPSGLVLYWFLFSLWQAVQQYQTSGWGGLTPFLSKLGLLKSDTQNEKGKNNKK